MPRQFVTGGAGFIGSRLTERLIEDGHEVTVYDDITGDGRGGWESPPPLPGLRFVKANIMDQQALKEAMQGHDFVWHLAANTDIPAGVRNTSLDLDNCVIGTHNVLEAMLTNHIKQMAFASSGAIYGDLMRAMPEDGGPLLPVSLYAAGKLSCEVFISAYCSLFDMQAWIFRFGNVVGARTGHGVAFDFIKKLRANASELEVLGDGEQEKNYFTVDDCIDGMRFVIDNSTAQCDIYNLGADTTTKVSTIARIVIEEMGLQGARIRYTGGDRGWPGDQPKVYLDTKKVTDMGWKPRNTSTEAVRIATRLLLDQEPTEVPSVSQ